MKFDNTVSAVVTGGASGPGEASARLAIFMAENTYFNAGYARQDGAVRTVPR